MKKTMIVTHILFLGVALLSAIHYLDIGRWKVEVALFAIAESIVVLASAALLAVKKTREKTVRYVYLLLAVMQCVPMIGAFVLSGSYMFYGFFHLLMITWCVIALFSMSRSKHAVHSGIV